MNAQDLLQQARHVQDDLSALSAALESSPCSPGVKSALSRNVCESQARILAVIEACTPGTGESVYVVEAVFPAP